MSLPAEGTSSSFPKTGIASQQKVEDTKGTLINKTKGTLINSSKGATVGVCKALFLEKHLGNPGVGEHKAGLKFIL